MAWVRLRKPAAAILVLRVVLWIVAAFAGAILALCALGLVSAVGRGLSIGFQRKALFPLPDPLVYLLFSACGFQATLLLGAMWEGWRVGNGDRGAGLGASPIRRLGTVAFLCLLMVAWVFALPTLLGAVPSLRALAKVATPGVLTPDGADGPAAVVLRLLLLAVLAPVSEELFFRGWLWEALRRAGHGAWSVAGWTSLPWLLLHGLDSPKRVLFLIPAAVVFSVARHVGGGVRASLMVHMSNNLTVVLMQAVPILFEPV